jgi:hypothetical protein
LLVLTTSGRLSKEYSQPNSHNLVILGMPCQPETQLVELEIEFSTLCLSMVVGMLSCQIK